MRVVGHRWLTVSEGGAEALSTLVVTQGDAFYLRSDAALRVIALLDAPFC